MKQRDQTQNLFYRSYELDRAAVNEEKRSIDVAFSSETPVTRYYGDEYLLHGKENADFRRLKSMGSALINHNPDRIVGSIKKVRLDDDRTGRATVYFDDDDDGTWALNKVKSGSLKGISVGYRILKMREIMRDEEFEMSGGKKISGPAMLATKWEAYEISFTPIPADASVGVGRSLEGIDIEKSQTTEANEMDEKEIREAIANGIKEAIPEIVSQVRAVVTEDARPKMRIDTETFQNLLGRAGAHSETLKSKVADMAVEGKTEREITNYILDETTPSADATDTGNGQGRDGTGMDAGEVKPGHVRFESMTDDDFFRGLSNPGLMAIQ